MDIRGIDFTAFSVTDLPKAVAYYRDNFGLKLDSEWEGVYAEFDVGGAAFGLYKGEGHFQGGTVAFNVPNLAEALAELKAKGIEPAGTEDTPVCRMAFFEDPDGNSFMLHEKPKV